MAAPPPAPDAPRPRRRPRLSKHAKIGLGLVFTVIGIACFGSVLPTEPNELSFALPVTALGFLTAWVGGILMGIGSRS
jgi:hypothetical protein